MKAQASLYPSEHDTKEKGPLGGAQYWLCVAALVTCAFVTYSRLGGVDIPPIGRSCVGRVESFAEAAEGICALPHDTPVSDSNFLLWHYL